jgi:hypothetical protein
LPDIGISIAATHKKNRGKQLTDRGKKYIAIRKLDLLGKWNYFEHLNIFLNYISL